MTFYAVFGIITGKYKIACCRHNYRKCKIMASLFLLFFSALTAKAQQTPDTVDVEIVLAVDASGSVNKDELQLQLNGIATAFRDPAVLKAISRGVHQTIAVSMLIWSDAAYSKHPTKWFLVNSSETAEKFAKKVETFNNRHGALTAIGGGGTGLGSGLAYALNMLEINNIHALRKIVDVSGDGPETTPWNKGAIILPTARAIANKNKITVNGLAIQTDIADLVAWYQQHLITGPGSFTIAASNFKDFARAIRLKLIREFTPVAVGQMAPKGNVAKSAMIARLR